MIEMNFKDGKDVLEFCRDIEFLLDYFDTDMDIRFSEDENGDPLNMWKLVPLLPRSPSVEGLSIIVPYKFSFKLEGLNLCDPHKQELYVQS